MVQDSKKGKREKEKFFNANFYFFNETLININCYFLIKFLFKVMYIEHKAAKINNTFQNFKSQNVQNLLLFIRTLSHGENFQSKLYFKKCKFSLEISNRKKKKKKRDKAPFPKSFILTKNLINVEDHLSKHIVCLFNATRGNKVSGFSRKREASKPPRKHRHRKISSEKLSDASHAPTVDS